mmetsp:Transcript_24930/g.72113  ORF Transcript_24930/g.72113 Transcript_24930/m.72113 type:complete len:111 (-) Transcript_24930:1130-1462(-)
MFHDDGGGGHVYFKSKKGARKAAAIATYGANVFASRQGNGTNGDGSVITQVMFTSKAEAIGAIPSTATVSVADKNNGGERNQVTDSLEATCSRRFSASGGANRESVAKGL